MNGDVTSSGTTTTDEYGHTILLVEDTKTHVEISKVDVVGGEELEGATIQIRRELAAGEEKAADKNYVEEDGKVYEVVEEWVSEKDKTHVVKGLLTETEYILREEVAPEGYTITSDTTFTIDVNGDVTSSGTTTTDEYGHTILLVEDTKTHVEISKVDVVGGEELEGATIQIRRELAAGEEKAADKNYVEEDGKVYEVVEEWVSEKDKTHVVKGLLTETEYILREEVAPEGYTITSDTTFTIDVNGDVTSSGTTTTDEYGHTILLVEDTKTHVEISKVDVVGGEELEGATIQIRRELAAGEEKAADKNYVEEDGKVYEVVEEWVSEKDKTHVVKGLLTETEYILREEVAPEGYTITSDTTFTIDVNGDVTSSGTTTTDEYGHTILLVEDTKTHVEISKVDVVGGEELEGATIQIRRELAAGEEKAADKNYVEEDGKVYEVVEEWVSEKDKTHVVKGLLTETEYILREEVAPEGYTITSDTTFTIDVNGDVTSSGTTTTDEYGHTILLVEDTKTHVEISKVDVVGGEELEGATIQIRENWPRVRRKRQTRTT
ncbi:SpaA isopeptide-forming pilin-related protein [Aristaeella hokkaidonensis]|uniref:Uncharacterized protein n=1 Tax=Aristaeella hokkaidonensis TaxID=3046382 RepID=A0AC61MZ64_9FIRM|nr:SpaA isopeptide-forming pilin-related protein [Aristaeella hokkaidonensis]QUC68540.1 hypothetical protein JYE49_07620 [Aristaeella hokkaidonensis]